MTTHLIKREMKMKIGMCNTTEKSCCVSRCIKVVVMAVVGIAFLGWVVMQLWNWLMPALFASAHTIDYCQALGILVLSKILFGSFRCGCHGRGRHHREENMTPEEREQLKSRLASRWGMWCCSPKRDDATAKDAPPHAG
jgi:hypothetical protein